MLVDSFSNVYLHFVKLSANRADHAIARQARSHAGHRFSERNVPSDLSDALLHDLSSV